MEAPFDAVAAGYDAGFSHTAVGQAQRARVHSFLKKYILQEKIPDLRVLELNCGTGEDALWLARQGCRVLATDVSAEMTALTRAKAEAAGLSFHIETRVLDLAMLPTDLPGGFDLVFSNFGGLNCLSPQQLASLGTVLPALLRPGGRVVVVVMSRFCWWESLYFSLKGRFAQAIRRWRGGPVEAPLGNGATVTTWYYGPGQTARLLGLKAGVVKPVGFWLPPSYLDPFFVKRPQLLRLLVWLERRMAWRVLAGGGDHFLVGGKPF